LLFIVWVFVFCLFFWKALEHLLHYALNNANASHILLVPLIVAWLLYQDRTEIAGHTSFDLPAALALAVPALLLTVTSLWVFSSRADTKLSLLIASLVLFLIVGFVGIFGRAASKGVWFSLALLGFAIPLPESLLNRIIHILQLGSAAVAEQIFDWSGVPVLREDFVFHLPGLSIEVARECSGIRSSIALIILALLVAHFSFSRLWKKAAFVFAGLLMMVIKNGIRIATLTILAKYVDPSFLYGRLHHEGGVVFFLIGLGLLIPVYLLLKRGETTSPGRERTI